MTTGYLLPGASLDWQDGTPVSTDYDDIYWHRGAALEEKTAVFINPALEQANPDAPFTIAELGFGFGINCLLTAEAWPANSRLNFVSIEKHPVPHSDLRKLLSQFQFKYAESLLAQYPPAYRGNHVIWLSPRIRLLLVLEDVGEALSNLDAKVDFWYLDGFAPARNSDMWTDSACRAMFARSRDGAGMATYSAASAVRQALGRAGFEVSKEPGFGRKKDRLRARKPGEWTPQSRSQGSIGVIGAGLAGRYCVEALQRRDLNVTLIDSGKPGPSAIDQLTVFPQLALAAEARYRFSLAALQYMQDADGFHRSGLRWVGRTPEEAERLERIAELFPDELIHQLDDGSVFYSRAGWLAPAKMANPDVLQASISRIAANDGTANDGRWICHAEDSAPLSFERVILATGFNRTLLPAQLQVRAIRGQAISVPSRGITTVLNGKATIFPDWQGRSVISGTYARSTSLEPSEEDTQELLANAMPLLEEPAWLDQQDVKPLVGIRAVSRDRLPIVGEMPDWQALDQVNRLSAITEHQRGLYLCTAFGSRGATHARLCAEHLVSKMLGEPAALGIREQRLLTPARFVFRDRED